MKRIICLLWALLLGVSLLAQGTVNTRKYRFSDFTDKVTKVVLSSEDVLSNTLRQEVMNHWTASAFEFCTLEEFESLKTQDKYYFLLLTEMRFKGEENPGIQFLSLVKGGADAAQGLNAMDEIIALPVAAAEMSSGRELVYLGSLVKAVQDFTLAALESEKNAYLKTEWFNGKYARFGKMKQLYLASEDLDESITEATLQSSLDSDMHIEDSERVDQVYLGAPYNTLVSYVIAPFSPSKGSYCYKLLFEADTQELFYITRHKIGPRKGAGFLPSDLKKLARAR